MDNGFIEVMNITQEVSWLRRQELAEKEDAGEIRNEQVALALKSCNERLDTDKKKGGKDTLLIIGWLVSETTRINNGEILYKPD